MGSGNTSRFSATLLRAIFSQVRFDRRQAKRMPAVQSSSLLSSLGPFCAVFRTPLFPICDARGIERTADNMVSDTGQILNATSADEHDRVLLQIMSDTRNVSCDLDLVSQANARDLTQSRIRLLWC
mgnify:CR=1 FL=1